DEVLEDSRRRKPESPRYGRLVVPGDGLRLTELANVRGLQALRPLNRVELHFLALGQAAKALARDRGVMDEHVRSALRRDETKPLCIVEPLHSALCHFSIPCHFPRCW